MKEYDIAKIWDFNRFGNNTALLDETGIEISYSELSEEATRIASSVGARCLVFSLCQNRIGSVVGYVAFLNNGIVPALLNSHLDDTLTDELIERYKPAYLWLPKEKKGRYPMMESIYESFGYELIKTGYDENVEIYPELALLLTTSGSTGSPKLVRQSYRNIIANTESIIEYLELDSSERPITTLPMNYTYGLSIINTHLAVGAVILLTDKTLLQKEFWHFFKEQRATSFGGVPYTYEMLVKLHFFRMRLPFLRTMTQAGGKLTLELHEKFAEYASETGKRFVVMYGQCEATARMGYLPAERAVEKKGSMGIAIPGGHFKLIDTEGNEIITPFTTGELVYEGANVTLGYAEQISDLAKGDEQNGILRTGDMAQFDEDGYYYIAGRKKRFLKVYGNRVNLDEMERLIKGMFDIDVACAGVDDHMCVFLTDNKNAEAVRSFASQKTGLNLAAFKVVVIDEIPKNEFGKVLYSGLSKYY